jgi:hypothetical protein
MCRVWQSQGVTSKIQVMPSVTVAMNSYLGRDSGKYGAEGVTAEINKCAECDSREAWLPRYKLCQVWQWQWKVTFGVTQEMTGRIVWPLKLTNVPSVTVTINGYPERDLRNDGEEGVTAEINKCAEYDSREVWLPRYKLCRVWQWGWKVTLCMTQEMMGRKVWLLKLTNVPSVTVRIKSYPERDLGNDGEEGVTAEINKCAECDSEDEKLPWVWLGKW